MLGFIEWLMETGDFELRPNRIPYRRSEKETLAGKKLGRKRSPFGQTKSGHDWFYARHPRSSQKTKMLDVPVHKIRSGQSHLDGRWTPMWAHKYGKEDPPKGIRHHDGTIQAYNGNHRINHAIRNNKPTIKMRIDIAGDKKRPK